MKMINLLIFGLVMFLLVGSVNAVDYVQVPVTANNLSESGHYGTLVPAQAIDNDIEVGWLSDNNANNYLAFDFGSSFDVTKAIVGFVAGSGFDDLGLQYSDNNADWFQSFRLINHATFYSLINYTITVNNGTHRYWRFYQCSRMSQKDNYCHIGEIWFYTGTDTTGPVTSLYNMTSDGGNISWRTDTTTSVPTTDGTPQVTFTTDEAANCSMRNVNHTYTASNICGTTGSTSHICNLYNADKLSYGTANLYIGCNDSLANAGYSPALAINMTAGGADVRGNCVSYLEFVEYTGITVDRTITVQCFNPDSSKYNNVSINPAAGWGYDDSMTVAANSTNTTVFYNTTARGTTDGSLYNISGFAITGSIIQTINTIEVFDFIDPVYAFTKDGQIDCTQNYTMEKAIDISSMNVEASGGGVFNILNNLKVGNLSVVNGCTVGIYSLYYKEDLDSYLCLDDWDPSFPCSNTFDGDWTTKGQSEDTVGKVANVYMNYTKPIGSTSASIWKLKSGLATVEADISECWDAYPDKVYFWVSSPTPTLRSTFWCRNSSEEWVQQHDSYNQVGHYEDAMIWDIENGSLEVLV